MATVLQQAPGIFRKVGMRIGYGPGKTKLILTQGCSREEFPFPLDDPAVPALNVYDGLKSCLGVPRHFNNDPEFLHYSLQNVGIAHDTLMDLTAEIADKEPFAALRLLQTWRISRFGHVLSTVPPPLANAFARERDDAIAATFATIQQSLKANSSTQTLLVGARGAGFTSLEANVPGGYLGAFFRIAGPL